MPLSCGVWGGWISKGFVLLRGNVVWGLVGFDRALLTLPFLSYCGEELGVLAVKAHMASCCPAGAGPCVSAPCFRVRAEQPGLWHEGSQRHAPAHPRGRGKQPRFLRHGSPWLPFFPFFYFSPKNHAGQGTAPFQAPLVSASRCCAHTPRGRSPVAPTGTMPRHRAGRTMGPGARRQSQRLRV